MDIRGYASWNFTLLNTFISLAQQREGEDKKHEYYVTAEYNGKILNNSGNINVNNPTPVIKITPKSSSKSKTTASTNNPQPKPQSNSAKGSTHQGSKNNQSDDKGIITNELILTFYFTQFSLFQSSSPKFKNIDKVSKNNEIHWAKHFS